MTQSEGSLGGNIVFGLAFGLVGLVLLVGFVQELRASRAIAGAAVCDDRTDSGCLRHERGVVVAIDDEYDGVTVRYDDGRRTADLTIDSRPLPPAGSRVTLERWPSYWSASTDIVAIVDERTGRAHHTDEWPSTGESVFGIPFSLVFVGIGAAALFEAFVELRRRARRRARRPRVEVRRPRPRKRRAVL